MTEQRTDLVDTGSGQNSVWVNSGSPDWADTVVKIPRIPAQGPMPAMPKPSPAAPRPTPVEHEPPKASRATAKATGKAAEASGPVLPAPPAVRRRSDPVPAGAIATAAPAAAPPAAEPPVTAPVAPVAPAPVPLARRRLRKQPVPVQAPPAPKPAPEQAAPKQVGPEQRPESKPKPVAKDKAPAVEPAAPPLILPPLVAPPVVEPPVVEPATEPPMPSIFVTPEPQAPVPAPVPAPAPQPAITVAPARKPGRRRRARLRISRIDPWSVMKTTFLFSIAFGIMTCVAIYALWMVLQGSDLFATLNQAVSEVLVSPTDTTPWRIENYVSTNKVLGIAALFSAINVVIITALATIGAFLYNLAANVIGGLEVTLSED